jgi:hypothetical protein
MEAPGRVPSLPVSSGGLRRPDGPSQRGQAVRVVEAEAGRHVGPGGHRSALRHVKKIHLNLETFLCQICKMYFPTLRLKQEHNQKVHSGSFTCIHCSNWSCTYLANLGWHMRAKHQGEGIQCKYNHSCGLYFKTQGDLHFREP